MVFSNPGRKTVGKVKGKRRLIGPREAITNPAEPRRSTAKRNTNAREVLNVSLIRGKIIISAPKYGKDQRAYPYQQKERAHRPFAALQTCRSGNDAELGWSKTDGLRHCK